MSDPLRILLVDDDRDIVRAVGIRLKAAGYEISTAFDGAAGVAAALADPPDAIILDIRMPGMDGLSALTELRQHESTCSIPALILSANVADKIRGEAMDLGAFCFLEKPCDPGDLLKNLEAAMYKKRLHMTTTTQPKEVQDTKAATPDVPPPEGSETETRKRILLVDDNQDFLLGLSKRFQQLGINVLTATNGLDALTLAVGKGPDLIILDVGLPTVDGLQICEMLGQNTSTATIPVIALTGIADNNTINRCRSLGAHYIYKHSDYWKELKTIVCDFLDVETETAPAADTQHGTVRHVPPEPAADGSVPKILVIDDDPHITRGLKLRLGALGFDVVEASNASEGTYLTWTESPDLIITDHNMPEMSGEQFIVKLKFDEETKDIPVIVITGQSVNGRENMGLKREIVGRRGAVAYLTKPVNINDLLDVLGRYVRIPSPPSKMPAPAHPQS